MKPHGIGDENLVSVGQTNSAGHGVQGCKEAVGGCNPGLGDGVEQGALAGVGISDEGGHWKSRAASAITLKEAGALEDDLTGLLDVYFCRG